MAENKEKSSESNLLKAINAQAEMIKKSEKTALIDIDVMLDYLRDLYKEYAMMRDQMETQKREAEKPVLKMRSLFDDQPEEIQTPPVATTVPTQIEGKVKQTKESIKPKNEKAEKIVFAPVEEKEVVLTETENLKAKRVEKTEEAVLEKKEIEFDSDDFNLGGEMENVSSTIEDTQKGQQDSEAKKQEKQTSAINEIDLDNIEFVNEYESTENIDKDERRTHHQMPPAYWGDEIDIEEPVGVRRSIADTYKQERPSVNDMLASYNSSQNVDSKFNVGKSTNLISAIDVNDKFLFVKELFSNNGSLFTEEIGKINDIKKLAEALSYLNILSEKYKWNEKSKAYESLYRLILKKYEK